MNEAARICFMIGKICAGYSKDYLQSETHRNEVIAWHLREFPPSPEALRILREVMREEYS